MNIYFKQRRGHMVTLCLDYETTVNEMLINYWKKVKKPVWFKSI